MEIEAVLMSHPEKLIADVSVAGVSGGRTNDEKVPHAWIVLSEAGKALGASEAIRELVAWHRTSLSRYKWLRGGIEVVSEVSWLYWTRLCLLWIWFSCLDTKVTEWENAEAATSGTTRATCAAGAPVEAVDWIIVAVQFVFMLQPTDLCLNWWTNNVSLKLLVVYYLFECCNFYLDLFT